MKKTIPFDLFGEKQELCFTITRIAEFERAMGKPLQQVIVTGDAGFAFCLAALPICLKRENSNHYALKIEEYLTADEGRVIDDIATKILEAIAASGALGKSLQTKALSQYYPELYKPVEDESEKNV